MWRANTYCFFLKKWVNFSYVLQKNYVSNLIQATAHSTIRHKQVLNHSTHKLLNQIKYKWMYNLATQVQVPPDANLGSYFQKTKIAVGASPTAFPFKKKLLCFII
jgi:hypothetical protein